jgi:hypothetical protein
MKKLLLFIFCFLSLRGISQMTGGSTGSNYTNGSSNNVKPPFHNSFYLGFVGNLKGGGLSKIYSGGITPIRLGSLFFFSKEGFFNNKFSIGLDVNYLTPTILFEYQQETIAFKNNFELGPCFSYNPVGNLFIDAYYRLGYSFIIHDDEPGGGFTNTIGINLRYSKLMVGAGINITRLSDYAKANLYYYYPIYLTKSNNLGLFQLSLGVCF